MSTVVPIGFESGIVWLDGQEQHEVTLPSESASLPRDVWLVWWSAFADIESAAAHTLTRDRLAQVAEKLGAGAAREHVDTLYENGLLADFDVDNPEEFFRSYKLYPLADGFGEAEKDSGRFQIAREGKALLEVSIDVYAVWCMSVYDASLWHTITRYAEGVQATPQEVAKAIAHMLPSLIANRCAFLQSV